MITIDRSEEPIASIIILTHDNLGLLAGCLESIQRSIDAKQVPYEVIVLFQQMDPSSVRSFLKSVQGIHPLQVPLNLGFGPGNNFAAAHARGEYLIFLNDDTVAQPGWLEQLIRTAESDSGIGAVGSRILFLDGSLQEAGVILWSDGSCYPLGRGEPPGSLAYSYVRPVDYASANGLLVRHASFKAIGGFDGRFFPGYYEDLDLCMALRHELGQRIVYEPRSVILHVESATMSRDPDFRAFLFRRHQAEFCAKWTGVLSAYAPPEPESKPAIERTVLRRRGNPARVLVIDDRLPKAGMGSGFGRAAHLFEDLDASRFAVALYPSDRRSVVSENELAEFGVDLVVEPLHEHLERPEKRYDVVVISRPHNFRAFNELLRTSLPEAAIVYDVEALYHKRLRLQARFESDDAERRRIESAADEMEALETEITRSADRLVAISDDELHWLEAVERHAPIEFIRPLLRRISLSPANPEARSNAAFIAGWLGGEQSPNVDALHWYASAVMPRVLDALPNFCTLVTGANPPLSVESMASRGIRLTGFVDSVDSVYAQARVAIAPIRAGAGVKNKTMEALQHGIPVVSTRVGAEGLGLVDGEAIDIADDPREFADRLIALATDPQLWMRRRDALIEKITEWERERISWADVVTRALRTTELQRRVQRR